MNERRKIEERLRKKEQEVLALEDQIKEARTYIQALQDVLRLFPKESEGQVNPEAVLRPGSAVAQARDIILKHGSPVHISVILQEIGKDINRESRSSLSGSIAAYVRKGEIFTRPAPNTFGLVELNSVPPSTPVEPPDTFGDVGRDAANSDDVPF